MRNVCKNVSWRPTDLFCWFCWNDSARTPLPAHFTQLFFQSSLSHTLCSRLEIHFTTNNPCDFWHSEFQQVSTYSFCSWDNIFTQKWNCISPNNLCMCNESPSTLSTNTSIVWNLYLSWNSHLVTSLKLEMNVWGFFEHQNKTSDTDRYKKYLFTARISQVSVNTMKRIFDHLCELQVAKCLIVDVLSRSNNVYSLQLRKKRKATQQWNLRVTNKIVLDQVRVYHESVCGQCRKQILVCEVLFLSTLLQIHYQHYFGKCAPDPY